MKKLFFIILIIIILFFGYLFYDKKYKYSIIKQSSQNYNNYITDYNYKIFINSFKFSCLKWNEYNKDIKTFFFEIDINELKVACHYFDKINSRDSFIEWIKKHFDLYKIEDNFGNSKFTAYVQANIDGSKIKTKQYKYPIYQFPNDMVKIDVSSFSDIKVKNKKYIYGRVNKNGDIVSYYPSEYIYNNKLNSKVLAYAKSRTDILYLQTQGSGIVKLKNDVLYLGYSANNGHKYKSVLRKLIKDNKIIDDYTWNGMRKWEKVTTKSQHVEYLKHNPRYIFFKKRKNINNKTIEPVGTFGYNLIPKHSIAVDNNFIPLGFAMILNIEKSKYNDTINNIVFSHDTGAAIKGGVRGDFYYGSSKKSYEKAKSFNINGYYSILIPKNSIIREVRR